MPLAERLLAEGAIEYHPTYFETVTAMAFVLFAERGVETAALEVGLGGRLDATNVVTPELSVITPHRFRPRGMAGAKHRSDRRGEGGDFETRRAGRNRAAASGGGGYVAGAGCGSGQSFDRRSGLGTAGLRTRPAWKLVSSRAMWRCAVLWLVSTRWRTRRRRWPRCARWAFRRKPSGTAIAATRWPGRLEAISERA